MLKHPLCGGLNVKFDAVDIVATRRRHETNQMVVERFLTHGLAKSSRAVLHPMSGTKTLVRISLDSTSTDKIKGGWTDIDVIITTPQVMGKVGALGRVLGPRGLMPNPKSGTVTMEVGKAVQDVKAGKIDFKVDKYGIIHASVGKVSFDAKQLEENAAEVLSTLMRLKPSAAKGTYMLSIALSSTMGPGIKVDQKSATA